MSSPEGSDGGTGSEQPPAVPAQPQAPAYGPQHPEAPAQPQPGSSAPYPGQHAPGYPGAAPTGADAPYGGGYPAPGQAYGTEPYGAQPYGSQPYGAQPQAAQPYAGQPYGSAPYGAPYPGYPGYGQVYPRNDLGIWSLVLALAGIVLGFTLLTGIPAVILGRRARQAVARGEANNDGIAVAGIVIGWIATALGALVAILVIGAIVFGFFASTSGRTY